MMLIINYSIHMQSIDLNNNNKNEDNSFHVSTMIIPHYENSMEIGMHQNPFH